jgi:hypothetical protein
LSEPAGLRGPVPFVWRIRLAGSQVTTSSLRDVNCGNIALQGVGMSIVAHTFL